MRNAITILNEFKNVSVDRGSNNILVAGTYAFRTAENSEHVRQTILLETGLSIRVLTEYEEAILSFYGAIHERGFSGTSLVVDIGAGSTEWLLGNSRIFETNSVPLGALTATERYLKSDPPTNQEWSEMQSAVIAKCQSFSPLKKGTDHTLGTGGTITSLAALDMGLEQYDSKRVDGYLLSKKRLDSLIIRLRSVDSTQRRIMISYDPERADIILAGAHILKVFMELGNRTEILVSDRGLRYGIALQELGIISATKL